MSWTEQLLPQQSGGTLMGCWDLVVPSDVCGARRRLRAAAAVKAISGAPPDHSVDAPVEVIEEAVEELLLVFEELASNGLRHGQAPVVARVERAGRPQARVGLPADTECSTSDRRRRLRCVIRSTEPDAIEVRPTRVNSEWPW